MNNEIISFAAQKFDLGKVKEIKALETKGDRKVYKVYTDKGMFIVKASASGYDEKIIAKDIYILEYLKKYKFNAPRLLMTSQGERVLNLADRAIYVYEFIQGSFPKPTPEYFVSLGKLLANLHNIPADSYPYKSNFIPKKELPKLIQNLKQITSTDQKEDAERLIEEISSFPDLNNLPISIIHTDPYFSNIIQNDTELFLIDLDDAGVAPAIIDVGYVLAHCCTTEPGDREKLKTDGEGIVWHQDWAECFLKAYQKIRKLSEEEIKLLPFAARFGMLVYITDWEVKHSLSKTRLERYKLLSKHVPALLDSNIYW